MKRDKVFLALASLGVALCLASIGAVILSSIKALDVLLPSSIGVAVAVLFYDKLTTRRATR